MPGKRIAIVDDEEEITYLLRIELEAAGYEVVTAHDGRVGLDVIKRTDPDLILLDIMMPEMDGFEVLETMKKDDLIKDVKVIMLTAKDFSKDIQRGLDLGADDYVTKPFTPELLIKKIETILP